MAVSIVAKK